MTRPRLAPSCRKCHRSNVTMVLTPTLGQWCFTCFREARPHEYAQLCQWIAEHPPIEEKEAPK